MLLRSAAQTEYPSLFGFSVSHTTRAPRPGELDGTHYHFTDRDSFLAGVADGKGYAARPSAAGAERLCGVGTRDAPIGVFDSGIGGWSVLRELRRELNTLVSAMHHRTGKPHGWIHNELRRICGGQPVAATLRREARL